MAGLLGDGWEDPRSSALMALAGGLLQGNMGAGLLGANQAYGQAKQDAFKQKYMDMQVQNMQSEIQQRQVATEQAKRKQAMIDGLLGGGGLGGGASAPAASGQLGSGSFGVLPPPAGQPAIPQASAPGGARVAGLGFDQLAALKLHGVDLTDLHKYANDPLKLESGSTYENRVTGRREYMPKLPEGMSPGANGVYGFVPGYGQAVTGLEGAKTEAVEAARSRYGLEKVVGPDGAERFVPRSQIVGAAQPGAAPAPRPMMSNPADADRFAILSQELVKARQSGNTGDVTALEREISRLPAAARSGTNPSGLSVPGFQATPTMAQKADMIRAEGTARADVERDSAKQKDAKLYGQMRAGIDRGIELLKQGPTASGIGSAVDLGANMFGMSTKGADIASQLDTLSGWLTANAPRMEGPQSNVDVQNYRVMAGMVGDKTIPISQRLAAAGEVKKLQDRYAELNGYKPEGGATGDFGGGKGPQKLDALPKTATKGARVRDTQTGEVLMFNGMSWTKEK